MRHLEMVLYNRSDGGSTVRDAHLLNPSRSHSHTLEHHQAKGDIACTKRGDTHTHTPYRVGEGDTRTPRTIRTQADLTFDDGPGQHVVVGHDIDIGQGGG